MLHMKHLIFIYCIDGLDCMKKTLTILLTFLLTFTSTSIVYADHGDHEEGEHQHHTIMTHDGVVGATPPGVKNSAVYFTVENSTNSDVMITSVRSSVSKIAELHSHSEINGAMSMRQLKSVHLPAHKKIIFKPSGLHIMLFDLDKPLIAGKTVELTLLLSNGKHVDVTVDVVMPSDIDSVHVHKKGMKSDGEMVKVSHSHH